MKRKVQLFFCIVIFMCISISLPALAGDLPESALLNADFCFIGEVNKLEGSLSSIKISEVLFGDYLQDTIELSELKYMEIGEYSLPKEGDYCAVVIDYSDGKYTVYEGLAAKADSLDKNTLKLKSSSEFIKRMNEYINNGWYSNQTIEDIKGKINADKQNTTTAQGVLTPSETINISEDENNTSIAEQNSNLLEKSNIIVWLTVVIVIFIFILLLCVILKKIKGKAKL